MNGFVFRLEESDFPLYASDWESNRAAFASPENRDSGLLRLPFAGRTRREVRGRILHQPGKSRLLRRF